MAPQLELAISTGVALVMGFVGNDLRRASLDARGYAETAVVAGTNLDAAEQRYFDQRPAMPATGWPARGPHDHG
ncbi:MAG: hypothetical protein U1E97_06925 [Alphaproteobacteria bacterium]